MAPRVNTATGRCAVKLYSVPGRENVACIETYMCPNNPDLNQVVYAIWGYARVNLPWQKYDTVDQLKQAILLVLR